MWFSATTACFAPELMSSFNSLYLVKREMQYLTREINAHKTNGDKTIITFNVIRAPFVYEKALLGEPPKMSNNDATLIPYLMLYQLWCLFASYRDASTTIVLVIAIFVKRNILKRE